jgi:hypothetical protein
MNGGSMNNVATYASNVSESGGDLILTLASSSSGAEAVANTYSLPVGGYIEAWVDFPGSGTTIYNWPAWWMSGPNWPAAGENDIAEGPGHRPLTTTRPQDLITGERSQVPGPMGSIRMAYTGRGLTRMRLGRNVREDLRYR